MDEWMGLIPNLGRGWIEALFKHGQITDNRWESTSYIVINSIISCQRCY